MMKKTDLLFLFLTVYGVSNPLVFAQNSEATILANDGRRTMKLSPQARIVERERSTPTIKIESIRAFLNRPKLLTEEEIENAGSIIGNVQQTVFLTEGSQIYAKGLDDSQIGKKYVIVKLGQAYRSPLEDDEGDILAHEAIYLGEAILKVPGEPALLKVTTAIHEIRRGARLLPLEKPVFQDDFYPHSPRFLEDAYIIAAIGEGSIISQYQIVVINKGSDDGMERGHQLAILKGKGRFRETIDSEAEGAEMDLPEQQIGILLVFRIFERVSYALVTSAFQPINLLDIVAVP
jgi:hypothetical protein